MWMEPDLTVVEELCSLIAKHNDEPQNTLSWGGKSHVVTLYNFPFKNEKKNSHTLYGPQTRVRIRWILRLSVLFQREKQKKEKSFHIMLWVAYNCLAFLSSQQISCKDGGSRRALREL